MSERIIVVTGASSGIGYALASELAQRNLTVLAVARRESLLLNLSVAYPNIHICVADISTAHGRGLVVNQLQAFNRPIHLIHNAAMVCPQAFANLTDANWRAALALNLEAPLWLTQACMPWFNYSRVLHVSSGLAHSAMSGLACYSMTKAALYMLYQVINTELSESLVIAGSIRPGVVDTPMQALLRHAHEEDFPDRDFFDGLHAKNQLRKPAAVAQYIANILLITNNQQFKSIEWNINNSEEIRPWQHE